MRAYVIHKHMPRLRKETKQERALKLVKGLRRNKGSPTALAKELGISRVAMHKQMQNPEFISLRRQRINAALKRAGITEDFLYGKLKKVMLAKVKTAFQGHVYESKFDDETVQLAGVKIGLELFEHLGGDLKEDSKPTEIHVHYGHRSRPGPSAVRPAD